MKREFDSTPDEKIERATFGRKHVGGDWNRISYHHSPPPVKKQHWSILLTGGVFLFGLIVTVIELILGVGR